MNDSQRNPAEADCVLRTMQSVANLNGRRVPLPIERELIRAVQRHVVGGTADVDRLPYVTPLELRERLRDPDQRAWLVRCAILVPYVSGEIEAAKVAAVDAVAMQLGTAPEVLRELHRLREQQVERVALAQGRRGSRIYLTVRTSARTRALVDLLQYRSGDRAMAERYRALGELPQRSLGRALFDFHRARGLALPGELRAADEALVARDVLHVLGGFATDPLAETALVGFVAGLERRPMGRHLVLEALAELHTVLHLSGAIASDDERPEVDLETLTAAYDRGVAADASVLRTWDWWADAASDLRAVRERLGVIVPAPARPLPVAVPAEPAKEPRAA